jgi:GTP-binding protein HflX
LLHVADASSPTVFDQISAVYNVLKELEIEEKDTLLVLNKIDAVQSPAVLNRVLDRYPNAIPVSARSEKGLNALIEAVGEALGREFLDVEVDVDPSDGRLLAYLSDKGEVLSRECRDDLLRVHVRIPAAAMGPVRRTAKAIRPADSTSEPDHSMSVEDSAVEIQPLGVNDPSSEVV